MALKVALVALALVAAVLAAPAADLIHSLPVYGQLFFFFVASALVAAVLAAPAADLIHSLPVYGQLLSNNYAGYVPLGDGRKSFYWFVESENKPKTDPLVLWLNGGPGCSSLLGLFEENGPYVMRHGGNFIQNEFRWQTNASILYLESPAGVGFSIDSDPPIMWDDANTARASYAFLNKWFELFPEFTTNDFHIGGESYAGHYVPQLAEQILNGSNTVLKSQMKGFFVGNPCTGDIGCPNPDPTLEVYLRYNGFMTLNPNIPTDANANYDPYDLLVPTCENDQLMSRVPFAHPVMDAYRRKKSKLGDAPAPYGPCADNYVTSWLNREDVKLAIHAETNVSWVTCSNTLNYTVNNGSVVYLYERFFAETNWSIMIYSGLSDSIVNFVQTQTIVNSMNRTLKVNEFQAWNLPYVYDASQTQLGGFYLEFENGFSWAGVRDAGHMVPQFNPPAGKELFTSYITTGKPGRM
ncbi:serine carboxypeptidase II-3-like, putative [Bodo saltans]|uniref:Carboxypeptidase n=1 Tax=Bodo saltans TaxID=75058 RepID=A0A0S4JC68_BODSA|nr:serine carboxypeptidase II-3-like, putative [Bodo saltans]|eukprot:CUG89099.1 serine carboxypeptidase II-3-like, putative [Bodo saltans]